MDQFLWIDDNTMYCRTKKTKGVWFDDWGGRYWCPRRLSHQNIFQ